MGPKMSFHSKSLFCPPNEVLCRFGSLLEPHFGCIFSVLRCFCLMKIGMLSGKAFRVFSTSFWVAFGTQNSGRGGRMETWETLVLLNESDVFEVSGGPVVRQSRSTNTVGKRRRSETSFEVIPGALWGLIFGNFGIISASVF